MSTSNSLRAGIGGPVGSCKTALCKRLCQATREHHDMAVVTIDIHTRANMESLLRANALPPGRLMGVETGACPHTAIREDAPINPGAIACLQDEFPALRLAPVSAPTWPS